MICWDPGWARDAAGWVICSEDRWQLRDVVVRRRRWAGSGSSQPGPLAVVRVQQVVEKRSVARQSRFCVSRVFESSVPTRGGAEPPARLGWVVAARRQHPRRFLRLKVARSRQAARFLLAEFPILAMCEARRRVKAISEGPLRMKKKRAAGDAASGGESVLDLDAAQPRGCLPRCGCWSGHEQGPRGGD